MNTKDKNEKKEPFRLTPDFIVRVVGSILLLAIAIWLILFALGEATVRSAMLLELSKVLAQVVFITVLGATVTFFYNLYAKDQEQNRVREQKDAEQRQIQRQKEEEQRKLEIDEDNKLRRELLRSVIDVRAQVEKARRSFRMLPAGEKKAGYRTTIEQILEARLRLSQVWHDTQTFSELYPGREKELYKGLTGMKEYLDHLIEEYEGCSADIQQADEQASLQKIGDLFYFGKFSAGTGGAFYEGVFLVENYRPVAQIIRQSILDSAR